MKIVFLDAKTIGDDIDLSGYDALGEVVKYGFSTPEEARERTKDADVIVLNKVVINEQSIGEAEHLKLVCDGDGNQQSRQGISGSAWDCMAQRGGLFHGDSGTAYVCVIVLSAGKVTLL